MLVDNSKHAKQTLEGQLGELSLRMANASKGVRKHGVAEMQKISNSEDQKIQSQLEAAVGAYEN